MLLESIDFGTPKWRVSMGGLIDRVHEAMDTSLSKGSFKDLQWKCKYYILNHHKIGTLSDLLN